MNKTGERIEQLLIAIYDRYGIGIFLILFGVLLIVMPSIQQLTIGRFTIVTAPLFVPTLVVGVGSILLGIFLIIQHTRFPRILRARRPQNVGRVMKALEEPGRGDNIKFFKNNILSVELSRYIGELARDALTDDKLSLGKFKDLLEVAKADGDKWLRCNAIELAGNGGVLERPDPSIKKEFVSLINDILQDAHLRKGQHMVCELARLKLALLEKDERHVGMLLKGIEDRSHWDSFYLRTFDDPLTALHGIIREQTFDPARAYAAALLDLLVKDPQVKRLEVDSALEREKRLEKPNERLIKQLENLHKRYDRFIS